MAGILGEVTPRDACATQAEQGEQAEAEAGGRVVSLVSQPQPLSSSGCSPAVSVLLSPAVLIPAASPARLGVPSSDG